MSKFSLDNIEDILLMVGTKCPEDMYEELTDFQCDCEKFDNCFDCWYHTVNTYQSEQFLKSANDESEEEVK